MTPHLKMKSAKILQEEKFGFSIICNKSLENETFCLTTGFFVEKYETIIKGKKAKENISFEHADANKVNLGFTPAESGQSYCLTGYSKF